jgi:hypothetical protein
MLDETDVDFTVVPLFRMDRSPVPKHLQESWNRSLHQYVIVDSNDLTSRRFILTAGTSFMMVGHVDFSTCAG